ncbi:MAG: ABC transporter ATP-binding protein [Ilumatobacteraceae bacterium]
MTGTDGRRRGGDASDGKAAGGIAGDNAGGIAENTVADATAHGSGDNPETGVPKQSSSTAELRGGRWHTVGVPTEKSKDFVGSSRRLLRRLQHERGRVAMALACTVASVVLIVVGPRILGEATNLVFDGLVRSANGGPGIDYDALARTLLLVTVLYVGGYLLGVYQAWLVAGIVQRAMHRLRSDIEAKLHRMPLGHLDTLPRGDLLGRVTNDIDNVSQSMQQSVSGLLSSLLTTVGVLVMMLTISWQLALIALVTVPVSVTMMKVIAKRAKAKFIAQWAHTGSLNAQVEETFTGHAVVKAFGRQREAQEKFDATNDQVFRTGYAAQFISGSVQPMTVMLANLNYVLIAVFGGLKVANGSIGLGDVQAFIQYSRQFAMPLTQVASMINTLQSGIASVERVFDVLDAPEQREEREEGEEHAAHAGSTTTDIETAAMGSAATSRGHVLFDHVSFRYKPDTPLIDDLSLTVEPGRTVAIVGPTGAGKTTLVNLLMRFYEIDGGRIVLDGRDIASMSRRELRSQMGMVLQDTWLFTGTIRENIRYGRPDATDDEVLAAARACYVDRFVHSLPHGYDTVLADDGTSVSAGEQQLLTIARAFLSDPSILILDEATSSVDTRTEVLIQRAMNTLRGGRTSFVIAHRLSTIRDADTIIVMDGGRIVEQGNHHELLQHRGAYFELYNAQFTAAATTTDVM